MKKLFFLLILSSTFYAQQFKEVKTAQDVIDNHVTAIGGADALRQVTSIKMEGSIEISGTPAPILYYVSNESYYVGVESVQFTFKTCYDGKNKTGWSQFGEKVTDFTEAQSKRTGESIVSLLWGYVLDPQKYNIVYKQLQDEKLNDADVYVIEFTRADTTVGTSYYDKKTFMQVKEIRGRNETENSDFKSVTALDDSKIMMPFSIKQQGTVIVKKYEFNKKLSKKYFKKPEQKEEGK